MRQHCRACKRETEWSEGIALENTFRWSADFPGDKPGHGRVIPDSVSRGVTVSKTGPPEVVKVNKCNDCGRSVTA